MANERIWTWALGAAGAVVGGIGGVLLGRKVGRTPPRENPGAAGLGHVAYGPIPYRGDTEKIVAIYAVRPMEEGYVPTEGPWYGSEKLTDCWSKFLVLAAEKQHCILLLLEQEDLRRHPDARYIASPFGSTGQALRYLQSAPEDFRAFFCGLVADAEAGIRLAYPSAK